MVKLTQRQERACLDAMHEAHGKGLIDEAEIVRYGAAKLGGDETALLLAQRLYNQRIKIHPAN